MTKIVEAMLKAMSEIVPDRVVAGSHGQACTNSFSGIHPETGKRFTYLEIQGGGAGARPGKDGPDGQDLHLGRFMNTPVEAAELENPVMIERYEFLPDSGGPGKYRGGLSLRRDIRFLTDVTWARYSDRQKFKPLGLFGGMEGSMGSLSDLLSICLPGSGGYGLPTERDPEAVRWDVVNGKISTESARRDYRVVFDEEMGVDMRETEALRNEIG
jgi:N-methylhydantoinase B